MLAQVGGLPRLAVLRQVRRRCAEHQTRLADIAGHQAGQRARRVERNALLVDLDRDGWLELLLSHVVEPELGRFFLPEENVTPSTHPVVVLSHGFWERSFAADEAIVGETIKLNGTHFTVVGIAPPAFTGTVPVLRPDLWTPLMTEPIINFISEGGSLIDQRGSRPLRLYGRLANGVTLVIERENLNTLHLRQFADLFDLRDNAVGNVDEIRSG